ncbi:Cytochrome P450 family protein [Quillaja saponaria]|uniref:Cytochrome P450 family protein n=1 Tax=Quillaja saponaria TaxID=32244 RepID=A0AAD7LH45_QUISA|nr:Cytochrome P450 family protein [Quillaja saponaria]
MTSFQYLNVATAGLAAIVFFFFYFLRRPRADGARKAPEASGGWPVIGHLPLLGGSQLPHITLGALADKYGPVFSIRIGVHPAIVVSSWELAKECFTTHDVIISSRPKFTGGELLGNNYANFGFSPYGDYWRDLRKITASELLSNRRLELLKHVRESEVESSLIELYKDWTKRQDGSGYVLVENMKNWFGDINFNVILRMVASKRYYGANSDLSNEKTEARRCQKAFREFFHLTGQFLLRDAIPFLGWLDLGGYVKAMKKTAKDLDSIIWEWLEEHRRRRENCSGDQPKTEHDFMDVMLSIFESDDSPDLAGYDVETVIKATCLTIIVGAADTTSVTLVWALSLLLNNPNALKKAQDELDLHVGKGRLVNESDISNLVYLQAIVKETLRLYPAGPLSGPREFAEDCTVGGYYVPAGTRLLVNLWKIQTDPRVWSDPLEFKPERFLNTHKDFDVRGQCFELIPFGGGRRACPGISFAIQMTHVALASLLQTFDVTTPSDAAVDMRATFGLTNIKTTPLEVLVKPRLSPYLYKST